MKDRERVCRYYEYEGKCLKGREGTFNKACQTCNRYNHKPGSHHRRKNNQAHKI